MAWCQNASTIYKLTGYVKELAGYEAKKQHVFFLPEIPL